jgi:hypothetical protein
VVDFLAHTIKKENGNRDDKAERTDVLIL